MLGRTGLSVIQVITRPLPAMSRQIQRTYYRPGRPYHGRLLKTPISTATAGNPFRKPATNVEMFGEKYVRNTIEEPDYPYKDTLFVTAPFLRSEPSSGGRHCVSIILNRWDSDNALDLSYMKRFKDLVYKFSSNNSFYSVLWRSKANNLCTGADLYYFFGALHRSGGLDELREYYREAYQAAYYMTNLSKPFFTFMTGHVAGLGAGLAVSSNFPLATETARLSFPGCAYGSLSAEAGSSFHMSRLPGFMGEYYLLSGKIMQASDICHVGIGLQYVASDRMSLVEQALCEVTDSKWAVIFDTLSKFREPVDPSKVFTYQAAIDRCFSYDTVADIMQALRDETEHEEWAKNTLARMEKNSPLAMAITLRCIRMARYLPHTACINMEYAIMSRLVQHHDFVEGVTAFVEARDPVWTFSKPEFVPFDLVESFLAPLPLRQRLRLEKIERNEKRFDMASASERFKMVLGVPRPDEVFVKSLDHYGGKYASLDSIRNWAVAQLQSTDGKFLYHAFLDHERDIAESMSRMVEIPEDMKTTSSL